MIVDTISLILVIIGALNWGSIGLFGVDVVSTIFGGSTGTYTLTWAWEFENNDKADTLLGNLEAETASAISDASTDIDFSITITATQID